MVSILLSHLKIKLLSLITSSISSISKIIYEYYVYKIIIKILFYLLILYMDYKDEYIIVLFNGFGSSKIFWNYAFEDKPELRKIDFLDKLKKIGKTYTFNQPFFNIGYYSTENNKKDKLLWGKIYKKYKPYSSNINFKLEDLDYKNICKKTYETVKKNMEIIKNILL